TREVDAFEGQVLAEGAGSEAEPVRVGPPRVVLGCVRVDRLVAAAVHAEVGLAVADEVDPTHRHPRLDGLLPDCGLDTAPVPLDDTRQPDVDRHDVHQIAPITSPPSDSGGVARDPVVAARLVAGEETLTEEAHTYERDRDVRADAA